jgi:D-alanine--poly(phosphoribitol) ligase subunit 1
MLQGACIYTIPKNQIRNNYIVKMLDDYQITVALMIPSVMHFLSRYFDEIENLSLKYSLFCGEALPIDLTEKWSICFPSAKIINLYGPTEATIFCTSYTFERNAANKSKNGIMSIGKPLHHVRAMVVDEKNQKVPVNGIGELCLSGAQITPGYLNNPDANRSSFFDTNLTNGSERFYKTGDACSMDSDGDILFTGRLDSQVKINGFRIELSEIEFHAKMLLTGVNMLALVYTNKWQTEEIGLVIESQEFDTEPLLSYLRKNLPSYMIPGAIRFESVFPLNDNGKTDRKELLKKFL